MLPAMQPIEQAAELALNAVTAAAVLLALWALVGLARAALGVGRGADDREELLRATPPPRRANPTALQELRP
jgi:hypothetical protein